MRTFLLVANAVVAVVFTAFFAYTFFGRVHIEGTAREFVTVKTQEWAAPVVEAAERAMQSKVIRSAFTAEQIAAVEAEFAEYRSAPGRYIRRLTTAEEFPVPESVRGRLAERISGWKEKIRGHYSKVLSRLLGDLRIFSGSNIIAACIAFACAWRSPARPALPLVVISLLLLVAIGLATCFYIDDFSFFTILFDWYLGWAYPVILAVLFFRLYAVMPREGRSSSGA